MNLALVVAGFLGATGVAAGAFGAHALEALVTPAQLDIWATAAQYHLIHAVVVMVLALSANHDRMSLGPWPVIGFTGGVVLFSFSLYAYELPINIEGRVSDLKQRGRGPRQGDGRGQV